MYGHLPVSWRVVADAGISRAVTEFAQQAKHWQMIAYDAIIEARTKQTVCTNKGRRDASFKLGDSVYLSTRNMRTPKGRARKLIPKYIGPFSIVHAEAKTSTDTLKLPKELSRTHNKFHADMLREYKPNDDSRFPNCESIKSYDLFADDDGKEWFVDSLAGHEWVGNNLYFFVRWRPGDMTREDFATVQPLAALDNYLAD